MSNRMKIVAGMGSVEDYIPLVEAGADEVFCGFVPFSWNYKYGNIMPLNRREVLFYHVQIGSLSEMKILHRMVQEYHVPVTVAMNALYYTQEQFEEIKTIMLDLMALGFEKYIVADMGLLRYLREEGVSCQIHVSGELGEVNRLTFDVLAPYHIQRMIFHRQNTLSDMASCIAAEKQKEHGVKEFEAFLLNERCQYSGAFCNSLHCDELTHMCKIPFKKIPVHSLREQDAGSWDVNGSDAYESKQSNQEEMDESYQVGESGCGLCALPKLWQAGVTHLKVVGRGNSCECMIQDIQAAKKAIEGLTHSEDAISFQKFVKEEVLQGCRQNCYYPEML